MLKKGCGVGGGGTYDLLYALKGKAAVGIPVPVVAPIGLAALGIFGYRSLRS